LPDGVNELQFSDLTVKTDEGASEAYLFTGPDFIPDIGFGGPVITYQDCGQMGRPAACIGNPFDFVTDFFFDLPGYQLSVYQIHVIGF
jgi:hypothetical protein